MALRRNLDRNTTLSHLIELRFERPRGVPVREISNVLPLVMKKAELSPGEQLAGHVANITAGVFRGNRQDASVRTAPDLECWPAIQQRVLAKARGGGLVGREGESRRQALWALQMSDKEADPAAVGSVKSDVKVIPGFYSPPMHIAVPAAEPVRGVEQTRARLRHPGLAKSCGN